MFGLGVLLYDLKGITGTSMISHHSHLGGVAFGLYYYY